MVQQRVDIHTRIILLLTIFMVAIVWNDGIISCLVCSLVLHRLTSDVEVFEE